MSYSSREKAINKAKKGIENEASEKANICGSETYV